MPAIHTRRHRTEDERMRIRASSPRIVWQLAILFRASIMFSEGGHQNDRAAFIMRFPLWFPRQFKGKKAYRDQWFCGQDP